MTMDSPNVFIKVPKTEIPKRLLHFWMAGLILRLIAINLASIAPELVPDFVFYRLPIAQCILSKGWLYCDCAYNHTPFYPYLSAALLWIAGDHSWLQVFFINLPLGLADAMVPLVLFLLIRKLRDEKLALSCAAFYALNPIAILEVGISHWDGFTVLFMLLGLLAIDKHQPISVGIWTGLGFALKQFPLALFPVFLLKTKSLKFTLFMGISVAAIIALFFLPFLFNCPTTLIDNLLNHPLWKGSASIGTGTLKNVFEHIGVPYPKQIWGISFLFLLVLPSLRVSHKNYIYYAGILMVTLAFFTYVTHRQLLVWCMPFIILITLERKSYIPFIMLFVGYAIRIIKPDWYFGLVHLGVGVWYYSAVYRRIVSLEPKVTIGQIQLDV